MKFVEEMWSLSTADALQQFIKTFRQTAPESVRSVALKYAKTDESKLPIGQYLLMCLSEVAVEWEPKALEQTWESLQSSSHKEQAMRTEVFAALEEFRDELARGGIMMPPVRMKKFGGKWFALMATITDRRPQTKGQLRLYIDGVPTHTKEPHPKVFRGTEDYGLRSNVRPSHGQNPDLAVYTRAFEVSHINDILYTWSDGTSSSTKRYKISTNHSGEPSLIELGLKS